MTASQLVRPEGIEAEQEPWLWANPDWKSGTPGLFAVIIGISQYDHLPSVKSPKRGPLGNMRGLAVSALTGLRVFEWLRDEYHVPGFPLARCRVLLSPTEKERQAASGFAEHSAVAGFDSCRDALRAWRSDVTRHGKLNQVCRTLFFFSGHGIELMDEQQVLLTRDWLREDTANEGINTRNLRLALSGTRATEQFYFIDACRNGNAELRKRIRSGMDVLDEQSPDNSWNPNVSSNVLYATTAGHAAWQPDDPATGLSVFGQALWDGLRGSTGIQTTPHDAGRAVLVNSLHSFVREEVSQALPGHRVPLFGYRLQDDTVTVIRPPLESSGS